MWLKNKFNQSFLSLMFLVNLISVQTKVILNTFRAETQFEHDFIETETQTIKEIREYMHKTNEDLNLTISEIITKHGYQFEEHEVQTEDGYILTVHRIPSNGKAVLLVHGITLGSESWIITGPENGLAFVLASQGYDVWISNARGNVHSRKHRFLNPNSTKFWKFSWNEIGIYDLPATIDYILELKGHTQLNYVGFSQGTTAFFVLCSELPRYNEKISVMVSLSTISWLSNLYSPFLRSLLKVNAFSYFTYNKYELLPLRATSSTLCNESSVSKFLCANFVYAIFGFDLGQMNVTNLPLVFKHSPAGCSFFQLKHYEQLIYSGKFRKFDYGLKKNLKIYGSVEPPNYNVKKITVPVAIFHSNFDWFSNKTDVLILKNKLENVIEFHTVQKPFNHIDYMFGKDIGKLVHTRILDLFQIREKLT